ncbi:MAG TPA: AraC family transcriptional regulator, partial [Bacteroidales bacterium]|nr:AraC family transcriptional regulator [Bacteroidales bacterium]
PLHLQETSPWMKHPFDIRQVTREMVGAILLNPAEPHRHDHEELIILTQGNPIHYIDFRSEVLTPPVILYIAQGKVHTFLPDEATRGWVIRYSADFIPDNRFTFYSGFLDEIRWCLDEGFCSTTLHELCGIMVRENSQEPPDLNLLRHLLQAVLSKLESATRQQFLDSRSTRNSQVITFNNFLKILEYNYKRPVGVDFYADKLNMSSRNLNLISGSVFGKSISDIIETRKMIEARNQLLNSERIIAEIGFDLGYSEKSYFTRVFRKRTGKTPTEFRREVQGVIS